MFCHVLAIPPIAEIFGQFLFKAVWTRDSRLDRHVRHLYVLSSGMVKIFADDSRLRKDLRTYLETNVTQFQDRGRVTVYSSPSSRRGENPSKVRLGHHTA